MRWLCGHKWSNSLRGNSLKIKPHPTVRTLTTPYLAPQYGPQQSPTSLPADNHPLPLGSENRVDNLLYVVGLGETHQIAVLAIRTGG